MYVLGDKYDIPLLKNLAVINFKASLLTFDPSMMRDLIQAIRTVYTMTLESDRALRDALVPFLKAHKNGLRTEEGFMRFFRSGLDDGAFAVDVVDAWAEFGSPGIFHVVTPATAASSSMSGWVCGSCGSVVLHQLLFCSGCGRSRRATAL